MPEKSEARRDGARLQHNSGRGQYAKGDATTEYLVIDYKEYAKSFSVNKSSWGKVCTDTMRVDTSKHPCIKIVLGEGAKRTRLGVLEWSYIEELIDKASKYDDYVERYGELEG